MALRRARFLPSQLLAAWEIVHDVYPALADDPEVLHALFGARREFLPRQGQPRTPHPEDIAAARMFRDQWGREYALADPEEYERDTERFDAVPPIAFTDSLFVAVPPAVVHAYRQQAQSIADQTLHLPVEDEAITLFPVDRADAAGINATVAAVRESPARRVASCMIKIDGFISTEPRTGAPSRQAVFEARIAALH